MKLPDFRNFEPLNRLRVAMGATELGNFAPSYSPDLLTIEEIDRLSKSGIEIPLDEVRTLQDGTLAYKDSRVLLYIRDVYQYKSGEEKLPRFHVSNCRRLDEMRSEGRIGRYVVATRDDGQFGLNIGAKGSGRLQPATRRLAVCQYCLGKLKFDGFDYTLPSNRKTAIVGKFTIGRFFELYPKSLHTVVPKHTAATAPKNEYTDDFRRISEALRREKNWLCDKCGRNFGSPNARRFLQVHHKDGQRNDNARSNLAVLCLGCHAEQPMHSHIKALPDYAEFRRTFGVR